MPTLEPDERPTLLTRRALLAMSAGVGSLFAIPAAIALSSDDYDYGDDDHDDDDDDRDDDHHDDDHDDHDRDDDDDDEGKVSAVGTVPPGSAEVRIVDDDEDAFKPRVITVDLGQAVTFVNLDDDPHTATGPGFDTGDIVPGEQATVTLDEPGIFPYVCQYHPEMTGTVQVRDASGEVPVASPVASPAVADDAVEIEILDFSFNPGEVEIAAGTTVTWTNQDGAPHTATADDGSFDTGTLETDDSASHTFTTPGTFTYICAFHPSMTGTVVVT